MSSAPILPSATRPSCCWVGNKLVFDAGNATTAAPFESRLDSVKPLDVGGGMPTRVNIPQTRLSDAMATVRAVLAGRDASA